MAFKNRSVFKLLLDLSIIMTLSYLVICILIFFKLAAVVPGHGDHHRNSPLAISWNTKSLTGPIKHYDSIRFPSQLPDVMLDGWFMQHPSSNKIVIITHGYNSSKHEPALIKTAWLLFRHGYSVLMYDLHNHGSSTIIDGRTALGAREYLDVLGAKQACLQLGFTPDAILYYGLSMGAVSTLIAAQYDTDITTIISQASFSDPNLIMKEEFNRKKIPLFLYHGSILIANHLFRFPIGTKSPLDLASTNLSTLLVIHSIHDHRVGYHHAQLLMNYAEKANITYTELVLDSTEHVDTIFKYENSFSSFFNRYLPRI
ncbi:hypothetical protein DID74_02285 [Candidatus Marinamargulisbacteria bacterium SCGC AG-333-B06]|nr:hypothetical protein DID74_02285 [Candidatus Marinamargulisbacteria bacterium SCGC AG-333-B06]